MATPAARPVGRAHASALVPLGVVLPMAVAAAITGQRDFIFPEGAALALGVGVLQMPDWTESGWRIAVLPPLCAVAGHLLASTDGPRWILEMAGVTAALLLLDAFGSRIAPALSAAALPVVFDVRSWIYPLVVLATCLAVVAALPGGDRSEERRTRGRWPRAIAFRGWLVICAWIAVAGPVLSLPIAALAPPLFVSALEWMNARERTLIEGVRRYGLLVVAAIAGAIISRAGLPEWITAPAAVGTMLVVMNITGFWHAPALAISLIPAIASGVPPLAFTVGIAVGAAALYVAASAAVAGHPPALRSPSARLDAPATDGLWRGQEA